MPIPGIEHKFVEYRFPASSRVLCSLQVKGIGGKWVSLFTEYSRADLIAHIQKTWVDVQEPTDEQWEVRPI